MDQKKTGEIIRDLRMAKKLTQAQLAETIGVSDKAVSKWERGCGAPDVSLLPQLCAALGVDTECLLRGDLAQKQKSSGNLKKMKFYVCPSCGNLLFSLEGAQISCCGKKLAPLEAQKAEAEDKLKVEVCDNEWFISSPHEMTREHYVSFAVFMTGDTVIVKKLYPEWNLEFRLPMQRHGVLYRYCTKDGLYYQYL